MVSSTREPAICARCREPISVGWELYVRIGEIFWPHHVGCGVDAIRERTAANQPRGPAPGGDATVNGKNERGSFFTPIRLARTAPDFVEVSVQLETDGLRRYFVECDGATATDAVTRATHFARKQLERTCLPIEWQVLSG